MNELDFQILATLNVQVNLIFCALPYDQQEIREILDLNIFYSNLFVYGKCNLKQ